MFDRSPILQGELNPNFIGCWNMSDTSMCDDIINFFENNPKYQNAGRTQGGVDEAKKKSIDISIKPNQITNEGYEVFGKYVEFLIGCFGDYKEQWPFLKSITGLQIGTFNVQKYNPGGHFNAVHTERDGGANMHRVLAFMTYLNTLNEGGETAFEYYGIRVQPAKGKTIIWPAEWTHAHSGGTVKHGHKYIVTGWIQFGT